MKSVHLSLDPFDRSNGNGSNNSSDDWIDGESIFRNEWGSQAATTFRPYDTDAHDQKIPKEKRERLKRWYEKHNGKGDPNRDVQIGKSYISNDTEMFCSVLELPERQRETVKKIVQNIDISSNNFGGRRYEKVILAICSLVSDEALSNQPNPSVNDRLFLSDEFRNLMEVCEMSGSEHRKLRVSVREKSDYFN